MAENVHLLLRAFNTDADVVSRRAVNNAVGMTEQMQAVLEERRFERDETFKLFYVNRSLEQLPVGILREVREDEL